MATYVTKDNITVKLTSDPYVDGLYDDVWYQGYGVDNDGNKYRIIWDLKPEYNGNNLPEDESDACDWDSPREIIKL